VDATSDSVGQDIWIQLKDEGNMEKVSDQNLRRYGPLKLNLSSSLANLYYGDTDRKLPVFRSLTRMESSSTLGYVIVLISSIRFRLH
jgi:hypothetical protein